jgi:transposase
MPRPWKSAKSADSHRRLEKSREKAARLFHIFHRPYYVRSYLLKEDFQFFWTYVRPYYAGVFLDRWCNRTMLSKIEPMKKVARMLRSHRELLLNWFRAKGTISSGVMEGLNNKLKLTTRKSYGFRTFKAAEVALYHTLGALPEPEWTHRFC